MHKSENNTHYVFDQKKIYQEAEQFIVKTLFVKQSTEKRHKRKILGVDLEN